MDSGSGKKIEEVLSNPFDNVYWLARMLINTDKFGAIGTDSKKMLELSNVIKKTINDLEQSSSASDVVSVLRQKVKYTILKDKRDGTKIKYFLECLCDELDKKLVTIEDYLILAFTCEKIMIPINQSLANVPNNDREFVESVAKNLFDTEGEAGLATIINLWDDLGTEGCLTAERVEVVKNFINLKDCLPTCFPNITEQEETITLSAFCQEFERRLGQKRKGRAGGSLETATSFILDYFEIPTTDEPEHFTTGLEIDRWVKGKDGWVIGISCKRTFRERWKQAYTTDLDLLNRHKIRELWHVITYDKDLSDDKITEIGSHRAILYLPDSSPIYKHASEHPGMKDYVRPITSFIKDLNALL